MVVKYNGTYYSDLTSGNYYVVIEDGDEWFKWFKVVNDNGQVGVYRRVFFTELEDITTLSNEVITTIPTYDTVVNGNGRVYPAGLLSSAVENYHKRQAEKKLRLSRNTDVKILHKFLRENGFWRLGKIKPMKTPFAIEQQLLAQSYKDDTGVFVDVVYNLQKLPIFVNINKSHKGATFAITIKLNATNSVTRIKSAISELLS